MKRDPRSALGWIVVSSDPSPDRPLSLLAHGNQPHQPHGSPLAGKRSPPLWLQGIPNSARSSASQVIPCDTPQLKKLRLLSDRIVTTSLTQATDLAHSIMANRHIPQCWRLLPRPAMTIHLSTYIFDGDRTGRSFVEALIAAAARGVEVRVIVDGLGEKYSRPTARKLLQGSRVHIARFLPMRQGGRLNLRNHRKILIIDGHVASAEE